MLVTPRLAGLPFVVSGMVAAGGLAAALSTADGCCCPFPARCRTTSTTKPVNLGARHAARGAFVQAPCWLAGRALGSSHRELAGRHPQLVTAAFSLAGSIFFPALVLSV